MQSCIRRRYARRQLRTLKTEARSATKFKEISYKLENKVVELTQSLQSRTTEKKDLQGKLIELERQLQSWIVKHEETDAKTKQLQNDIQTLHVPKARYQELTEAKRVIDEKLEESARKVAQQDEEIRSLTAELERQTQEMDAKVKAADGLPPDPASACQSPGRRPCSRPDVVDAGDLDLSDRVAQRPGADAENIVAVIDKTAGGFDRPLGARVPVDVLRRGMPILNMPGHCAAS